VTISSTIRKAGPYPGNGLSVALPFEFKVFTAADVLAVKAVTATGAETALTLGTDYTVSLNADQDAMPGGTLTLVTAHATGTTVTLTTQIENTQGTDLTNLGGFYPKVINDALDRATIQIQQLAEKLSRVLTFGISSGASGSLPNPTPLGLLGWNAAGTALQNFVGAASASVSTFMANVVAAVDEVAAQTALGATAVGRAVFAAANAAAARLAIGAAASGANADITSLNSLVSTNGGPLGGFRNLLINGNFSVNEWGYVSGTATTGANKYTLDRWRVVVSGQSITFVASGIGRIVTAPAGGVEQVIRGYNIRGGSYVLNWVGTATATVNGTARTKGEVFTLPVNTDATIRLIGGTASEVQLEFGTVATAFEHRFPADELRLCKRFFYKSFDGPLGTSPGDNGAIYSQVNTSASPADCPVSLRFEEEMDRVPDVTPRNPTQAWGNLAWRSSSDALDVGLTFLNANRQGANLRLNGVPAGQWVRGHFTADAEVY